MGDSDRRDFLKHLAAVTGGVVLAPIAVSCGGSQAVTQPIAEVDTSGLAPVPLVKPADWDPVAFNKERGLKGGIPESYHADITGADGVAKHLGKHLPYIPEINPELVPEGYLPIMWGDPDLGYARHPNAPAGDPSYPKGHWYNWVTIRKATSEETEEKKSVFADWPGSSDEESKFVAVDGGDVKADGGKNTTYLVELPSDVSSGDELRIYGHCLYHGEYVDFLKWG